jgi:hypothetical protein
MRVTSHEWCAGTSDSGVSALPEFAAADEGPLTQLKTQRHLREEIRTDKPGHVIYEEEWQRVAEPPQRHNAAEKISNPDATAIASEVDCSRMTGNSSLIL